jgi:hypothetical protein
MPELINVARALMGSVPEVKSAIYLWQLHKLLHVGLQALACLGLSRPRCKQAHPDGYQEQA